MKEDFFCSLAGLKVPFQESNLVSIRQLSFMKYEPF